MKKILLGLLIVPILFVNSVKAYELVDSGIEYKDIKESINRSDYLCNSLSYCTRDALYLNPERGFYSTNTLRLYQDDSKNKAMNIGSWTGSLLFLRVDISDFSGAYHLDDDGERGDDALLTTSALNTLGDTLNNIRNNNRQVILRFVYDKNGDGIVNNEGYRKNNQVIVEARQEMILKHIEQLSKVFNEYADVIYTIQEGIYGAYGELHSTSMCTNENINEALNRLLEETRSTGIFISLRTPSRYAYYKGINVSNITSYSSYKGEDAYRISIFNDGYLGSLSDLGTFYNREKEINWLEGQTTHTPYGGEAVVNIDKNSQGYVYIMDNMSSMANVLSEMPRTHTSYLNFEWRQDLHKEWAKTTYTRNDEYKNDSLYKYIEYHLGYRLVLKKSMISSKVEKGTNLVNNFTVENVGFGNILRKKVATIIITDMNGNVVYTLNSNIDAMSYLSGKSVTSNINITIPDNFQNGNYKLYIQFKIGNRVNNSKTLPYGSIRFANNTWNSNIEANYLGTFEVIDRVPEVTPEPKKNNKEQNNTINQTNNNQANNNTSQINTNQSNNNTNEANSNNQINENINDENKEELSEEEKTWYEENLKSIIASIVIIVSLFIMYIIIIPKAN